jgi:hypothetical protein
LKKFNKYQKIILVLYSLGFIYFAIIHIPFKIKRGNEIAYDTLFSNRANVDFGKLFLIIIITTLISIALLLLARNLRLTFKLKPVPKSKPSFYILLGIIIIAFSGFFLIKKYYSNLTWNKSPASFDSTSVTANSGRMNNDSFGNFINKDTTTQIDVPPFFKNKYLYKGKIVDFGDIVDAAKQSNFDVDSYIKKADIVALDEE